MATNNVPQDSSTNIIKKQLNETKNLNVKENPKNIEMQPLNDSKPPLPSEDKQERENRLDENKNDAVTTEKEKLEISEDPYNIIDPPKM